eukprot:TRINITY_DN541_c0_g1_i2.p1 TRINITY_DN541_c0_g1~~TRINITY_DN541_c0_g1_i2.p1  ORF type:complete len:156 (-),score=17.71 TRINITY_DN541_c0_g1_i2:679-1146(-)
MASNTLLKLSSSSSFGLNSSSSFEDYYFQRDTPSRFSTLQKHKKPLIVGLVFLALCTVGAVVMFQLFPALSTYKPRNNASDVVDPSNSSAIPNRKGIAVWLGNGCFWERQYDYVNLEMDPDGPFAGRYATYKLLIILMLIFFNVDTIYIVLRILL